MAKILKFEYLFIILFSNLVLNGCKDDSINEAPKVYLILTDTSAYYSDDDLSLVIGPGIEADSLIDSLIVPPKPLKSVAPSYPEEARRQNIQGEVWIKMLVMKDGTIKRAFIMQSASTIFNRPTLAAAMQWTLIPATYIGEPINVWVSVPFRFRLSGT